MNHYCCVPQCSSWVKRNPELSFKTFPRAGKGNIVVETKLGNKELVDRRQMWIRLLKIGKKPSIHMRVCSLHFAESDFLQKDRVKRRTLKLKTVPSKNLPKILHEADPGPSSRIPRTRQMKTSSSTTNEANPNNATEIIPFCENDGNVEDPQDREAAEAILPLLNPQNMDELAVPGPSHRDSAVQVNTPKVLTLCDLISSDEKLRNFTGINNFAIFNGIVEIFEKYHSDKRVRRLNIRQRIMLLLTKFKTSLTYVTLGSLFGITPDLAKTYIYEMIPVLSRILKPLIIFPSKTEIMKNMPICFKEFQDVRVILDCTEIFVQSPKCLCCRIRFYSQYKSNVTVKFMTGVSPGGLITFLSKPYGGRASDKVIFEESNIISLLEPNNDALMVDKGFLIDDICNLYKIKLIRPPFLRSKSQLSVEESILNAKIASARVHIERSNQRLKFFKIISGKLNWALVPMIEDIFIIISAITNLSSPILGDSRFLLK